MKCYIYIGVPPNSQPLKKFEEENIDLSLVHVLSTSPHSISHHLTV
jgi:hypothetical protein